MSNRFNLQARILQPTLFMDASINSDTAHNIVREIYLALEKLGAHHHLLAAVGGWGDVADDARTLYELRLWNSGADPEAALARDFVRRLKLRSVNSSLISPARLKTELERATMAESVTLPAEFFRDLCQQALLASEA